MSDAKQREIWRGAHVQSERVTEEHIQRRIKANEAQRRLTEEVHKRSNELLRQREEAARQTSEEKNDDKSES